MGANDKYIYDINRRRLMVGYDSDTDAFVPIKVDSDGKIVITV